MRLRSLVRLNPPKSETAHLADATEVTFAPMEAISDELGGLDASNVRPLFEVANGSYSYFAEGDILLAKVTPCFENGKKAIAGGLANGIGFATSEVHVIRPDTRRIVTNYLRYLLCSEPFRAAGMASMTGAGGLRRVSEDAVLNFRLPIVDLDTQHAIATFLDRETTHIDDLIEKKRSFLALIEEKRASLVERAVNGAILPQSDQAGIKGWFGQLPSSWDVRRGRFLFRERQQRSVDGSEELLTVSHITGVTTRSAKDVNMFLAESLEGYKVVEAGDVVVNTMWAWMGAMGVSDLDGVASPSYGVYRPTSDEFDRRFLDLLLRSKPFVAEVNRRSKGVWASRLRLYADAFLDIVFPIPLRAAQNAILSKLSEAMATEERIAALSRGSIERLRELRSALITAAVTGQIDMASWDKRGEIGRSIDATQESFA
jgi:type I restriction enzyme, S subunit